MNNLLISAPQIVFILIILGVFNLPIYGLSNRNIASRAGRNIKYAFWLGLLGPLGTIICLFQSVETTFKKILFAIGRLILLSIGLQIFIELGIISESLSSVLTYFIGIPFVLRGKNVIKFSTQQSGR